jgi:hypothetical protein
MYLIRFMVWLSVLCWLIWKNWLPKIGLSKPGLITLFLRNSPLESLMGHANLVQSDFDHSTAIVSDIRCLKVYQRAICSVRIVNASSL